MDFLEQLNPAQRDAVSVLDGPLMIVAGAGSGKTRVLTYRIANLIRHSIKPHEILALTFTNKAANEMKSRIGALVGHHAAAIWAGTFHSIFARILRQEALVLGYDRNFTIYDADDSLHVVKNVLSDLNISSQQFNPRSIQSRISGAKNQLVTPDRYEELAKDPLERTTALVFAEYQERLFRNNAMDFDDLLLRPIDLFQGHASILEKYQYRFKYLLVDEYQDTNRAQYVLINLLAGKFRNICVVGDDAQSIYAFRGADIRNILDFERDYPDCRLFRLEENYRSTKTILGAADSLIKQNRNQIHKTLWTSNPKGEQVVVIEAEDDKEEGLRIVQTVQEQCARLKIDLKDIAVLYRTNAQSRSIEDALRRSSIPYTIVGGIEFYKRKEIKDVLAYLRVVVNQRDEESILRIVNFPLRGIGDTTIQKIQRYRSSLDDAQFSLFSMLEKIDDVPTLSGKTRTAIHDFIRFIKKYIQLLPAMSASELAHTLVDDLGILRALKEEATPESLSRWENVLELLSAITEYSSDKSDAGLAQFLEEVSLMSAVDKEVDQKNSVTLMTLHAAKGLEFPIVFITGLEEGLFPLYQSTLENQELEEERRLMYVGMTRAMLRLYLTYTRMRFRAGEVTYPVVSRFLDEIDSSYLMKLGYDAGSRAEKTDVTHRNKSPQNRPQRNDKPRLRREEFQSDPLPEYENESQEFIDVRVGCRVEHETFGKGKVIQLAGRGESAKAVVLFDSVGPKNLMLKYANLRMV